MTMMTFETDNPQSCGVVEFDNLGVMTGLHEKVSDPPGRIANAAVYVFEDSIFDELVVFDKKTIDLSTEILPTMIGRALCYRNYEYHRDIGTVKSFLAAQLELPLLCPRHVNGDRSNDDSWLALLESGDPSLASQILQSVKTSLTDGLGRSGI